MASNVNELGSSRRAGLGRPPFRSGLVPFQLSILAE